MRASTLFASFATAALVTLAEAHGMVSKITVAGQTFTAPAIGASGSSGPFYLPSSNSPVTDVTSDNLLCNVVATQPDEMPPIDISQGNSISFYWDSGYSTSNWPHNTGPMFLYMAQCDGNCTSQTASTKFIKFEQQGYTSSGVWAQAQVMTGQPATFTIPSDLAPGNYLVRHEILNLASTDEFYPSCSQFTITGGGNNDYSTAATAQFPGAYSASDAGLTVAGSAVYSIKNNNGYTFPGPVPVEDTTSGEFDSTSASSSSSSNSTSSSTSSVSGTSTSISVTSTATGVSSVSGTSSSTSVTSVATGVSSSSTSITSTTTGASSVSNTSSSTSVTSAATGGIAVALTSASSSATSTTALAITTSSSTATASISATTSASSSSDSSTDSDSCGTQWTECNESWQSATASASDSSSTSYDCQTQYVSCVEASMSSSMATTTGSINARFYPKNYVRRHRLSRMEKGMY